MTEIQNLLKDPKLKQQDYNEKEFNRIKEKGYNASQGNLNKSDGYNCTLCNNRGKFLKIDKYGHETIVYCKCMAIRENIRALNNSGLKDIYEKCRFDNFVSDNPFQKAILEKAKSFLNVYKDNWFYIGGQIGCGKTHICTAICGKLIEQGISVKYISWRTEINKLKQIITDEERYQSRLSELKGIKVLYIDDLSKGGMSESDLRILFEIIDHRYKNQGLTTIISSEKLINDLMAVDEATASRIYEKCKDFCIEINSDRNKNYRLTGAKNQC